jgi:hypothetical protein
MFSGDNINILTVHDSIVRCSTIHEFLDDNSSRCAVAWWLGYVDVRSTCSPLVTAFEEQISALYELNAQVTHRLC